MIEGQKSYGAGLWMLAAGAILLLLLGQQSLDSRDTLPIDAGATSYSRGSETNSTVNQTEETEQIDAVDQTEEEEYGPYSDYGEYGEAGYPDENKCGSADFGYPSYIGTNKEGDTCADAYSWERDDECVANPPYNYDGEILIATSNPPLSCCVLDGTCHWEAQP